MGAARLLLEKSLPLDLEKTYWKCFLIDGRMDSKDVWYTDVIMKRCRSSSNMDAARLLLEKLLPLGLENLKMTVSVHFLKVWWIQNYIWYTYVSWRDAGLLILIFFFFKGEGCCIFIHLQLPQNCWNDFNESW
jgi:hypothetical protein